MDVTYILETGAGIVDASSYVSLDEAKQFWYNKSYGYGTLTDDDFKRLLNNASAYIDDSYRKGFPGYRQYIEQALEWPRSNAYYIDGYDINENLVPVEVKRAVYETAFLLFSGTDLALIIDKNGIAVKTSVKVDVIEESNSYSDGTGLYSDIYPVIDNALSRITGGVSDRFILKSIRVGGESP